MYKSLIVFILLLVLKTTAAQQPVLQWAKAFVAHNEYNPSVYSNGRSVAVDRQGNVYSAGLFTYTTDFDPGPGLFLLSADNWANTGIYISKLSATGDFIWAIQVPALVEFGNIEISVDKDDNVYLASELRDTTDFDPGPGVYLLAPIGGWDAFVAKYDAGGNLVWAKQFGGPGDTVPRSDVLDIDENNNVIVCGNFNNTVDFDPGPGTFNMTSTAHIQSFIVKLTSNGDFIWARQFGNAPVVYSGSNIADVKCDLQGNIYTVGNFTGTCDFDPGPGTFTMMGENLRDGYIAKLDPDGNLIWAKRVGQMPNSNNEHADSRGIDIDSENNVYTTGDIIGTFDFDPGENTYNVTSTAGSYDWYLLKLNARGDFVWVDIFAGNEHDIGADVAVGADGGIYTIGSIGHTADMDPGPGVYNVTTVNQYGASLLTKVNSDGGLMYAVPFDSPGADYGTTLTRRMVAGNSGDIYITGALSGTIDFDPGMGVYPLSSGADEAPFVLKLSKCANSTTSTLTVNQCTSYTMNNETFDSTGTYIRTMANAAGCDSVITLYLMINKKHAQQTIAICEGATFFAGGANRTISGIYKDTLRTSLGCDSILTTYLTVHPKPLPSLGPDVNLCAGEQSVLQPGPFTRYLWQDGSTGNSFTAAKAGVYWVQVTDNFNCSARDSFIVRSILPLPANFLKKADSLCSYETLQVAPAGIYNQYLWSTASVEQAVIVDKPGIYWLTVTDANGCVGTDSISVFIKDCMSGVYIPNAFTPNSDGNNDVFRALVFGKLKAFRLQVFDRAGQVVFQTTDPQKGWDGLNKGKPHPARVFVWQCTYQLDNKTPGYQKGTVMIVR